LRQFLVPANPLECTTTCTSDSDCQPADSLGVDPVCAKPPGADEMDTGTCRTPAQLTLTYLDPSRNFDLFFSKYMEHTLNMARVAAAHGAAMMVLGGGSPYLTGSGQSKFADNSLMKDRRQDLGQRWSALL